MSTEAIRKRTTVAAAIGEVWEAWTTETGVRSFFAPAARVEPRPGGAYEMFFDAEQPEGKRGSEGMRILSLAPERMLSFEWNAPPIFPNVRNDPTWVVLFFESLGPKETAVELQHFGWKSGEEWEKARAYFERAWGVVLARLGRRFVSGPIDWNDPYVPADAGGDDSHLRVERVTGRDALERVFPVIQELRPHLTLGRFIELVEAAAADRYTIVAAFDGDRCVAAMGYRLLHDLVHGRHLYIDDLVTSQASRSRGIGARLLRLAETQAREWGCEGMRLCTGIDRWDSRRFYEREGWDARAVAYKKVFRSS